MKNYFTEDDEKLKWTTGEKKQLLHTCVFDVTVNHNTSYTGVSGDYIGLDAKDWCNVIAEKDGNFLLVKQWRHGEKTLSIEFPGGVIDPGETPEEAAARELREETGYIAGKLTKLGSVNPNPALFTNHMHFFLAEDLKAVGEQELDADEFINCIELTKNEVMELQGTEQFPHALMGTAMILYMKHRGFKF